MTKIVPKLIVVIKFILGTVVVLTDVCVRAFMGLDCSELESLLLGLGLVAIDTSSFQGEMYCTFP